MAKARKGSISVRRNRPGPDQAPPPAKPQRKTGAPGPKEGRRAGMLWKALAAAALLALLCAAYGGTLHHSFQFDDYNIIVNNERIHRLHLPTVISSNFFRPVLFVTFALDYHFGGADPFGYRLVNLGLHLLNMVLVFHILSTLIGVIDRRRASGAGGQPATDTFGPALLGTAVFGLHPLQTESVTYIASRSSVLCTTFVLFTIVAFLAARIDDPSGPVPAGRRMMLLGAATVSFILGVATKELGIAAPLLLLLMEFIVFSGNGGLAGRARNLVRYHLPFIVLILAGAGFRLAFMFRLHNPADFRSPWHNLLSQFRVVVRYMVMLFLPVDQNVDPDVRTSKSLFEPAVLLSLLVIAGLLALAWYWRRRQPLASLGIFIWFTALLPTSSIIPLRDLMAEHRVYLPMMGAALVAASLPGLLTPRSRRVGTIAVVAALAVGLALATASRQRNKVWATNLSLWADAVSKAPDKERPVMHYANAISATGQYEQARRLYEKVLALNPENATARYNLGIVYKLLGDYERAVEEWRRVVRLEPGHPNVHVNIGNYHFSRGELDRALLEFKAEVHRNPRNPLGHFNLGNYWRKVGNPGKAEKHWLRALRHKGDLEACRLRLGSLYFETDRLPEARRQFEAILRANPRSAPALFNLGHVTYREGKVAEAARLYERSAAADPTFVDPLVNAGGIYVQELQQPEKGASLLKEALRRNPDHPSAPAIRQTLGRLQGRGN